MDVWVFSHRKTTKFGISTFVMYRGTIGREGRRSAENVNVQIVNVIAFLITCECEHVLGIRCGGLIE